VQPLVLDAIERNDADFFIPSGWKPGFRFTSRLLLPGRDGVRMGVLTLPMPRAPTEAWFAAVVGSASDPAYLRYLLLEQGESGPEGSPSTVLTEWSSTTHRNYGAGPPSTANLANDRGAFLDRVAQICSKK
jgi:hypothetical protein